MHPRSPVGEIFFRSLQTFLMLLSSALCTTMCKVSRVSIEQKFFYVKMCASDLGHLREEHISPSSLGIKLFAPLVDLNLSISKERARLSWESRTR